MEELKLRCSCCKKTMVAEGNFKKTTNKTAVENRSGYVYTCINCNRDNTMINKASKRDVGELQAHIMNQVRVLNLNLKALAKLTEDDIVTAAEERIKVSIGHHIDLPFIKV